MKIKLSLSIMLSSAIIAIFTPCSGMDLDPFPARIKELTGLTLAVEKFTPQLSGYTLPPFPLEQRNRNHFDDRSEGSFTPINSLVMH